MTNPLVSIVCITYNHEPYLRQALDGFLMQRTTFPVEIILAEDCSTDGTRAICEEYAKRYPDKIRYIWSETNVGAVANERRAIEAASGKYLAFCEGDDYWTDADKLQLQVDWLETHPDYSVCWHRYICKIEETEIVCPEDKYLTYTHDGFDITLENLFTCWKTQYLTMMCRRELYDNELCLKFHYFRDTHQMYYLLKQGKGRVLPFVGGVYRQTGSGEFSARSEKSMVETIISVDRDLLKKNYFESSINNAFAKDLQYRLDHFRHENTKWQNFCDALRIFVRNGKISRLYKNIFNPKV